MLTIEDRALGLEALGFTPRQARFLATAALHSGYCLRRQYVASAGVAYGKNVRDFLDSLVGRRLAERFSVRADRGHVYHLNARTLYRALRQEDNRNRREASAALIARRVMLLDYVLSHAEVEWLATETDKVELFAERFGIDRRELPQRAYAAANPGGEPTIRFFPHKLPVAVVGDPPIVHFVYLAAEPGAGGFETFLREHAALFGRLSAWTVVAVAPSSLSTSAAASEAAFNRFLGRPLLALAKRSADLRAYFGTRKAIDAGNVTRLSVAEINEFRNLRERYSGSEFETVYRDWLERGDAAFAMNEPGTVSNRRSVGRLLTEVLAFDYSQFGSLPGVA